MTDHLLPITAGQLAGLPDHTPVLVRHDEHTLACCVLATDAEGRVVLPIAGSDPDLDRLPNTCVLDLSDLVTRAVVAARVRLWLDSPPRLGPVLRLVIVETRRRGLPVWAMRPMAPWDYHLGALRGPGTAAPVREILTLAERFRDMTADQIVTLTRLARAALEVT